MVSDTDCFASPTDSAIGTKKVEVGPSSFVKVKMLGKGDVGKVYLVREKKTDKLFAMKGTLRTYHGGCLLRSLTVLQCCRKRK